MSLLGMFLLGVVLFVIGVVIDRKSKTPDGTVGSIWRAGRLVEVASTGRIFKDLGKILCAGAVMLFLPKLLESLR